MATPEKKTTDSKKTPKPGVDRSVVEIGLNFDPIPVHVGDGRIWYFTPEADPGTMTKLLALSTDFAKFKDLRDGDTEALSQMDFGSLNEKLSVAVAQLLIDPAERKDWIERGYGLLAQAKVANVLIKEMSGGFPTT